MYVGSKNISRFTVRSNSLLHWFFLPYTVFQYIIRITPSDFRNLRSNSIYIFYFQCQIWRYTFIIINFKRVNTVFVEYIFRFIRNLCYTAVIYCHICKFTSFIYQITGSVNGFFKLNRNLRFFRIYFGYRGKWRRCFVDIINSYNITALIAVIVFKEHTYRTRFCKCDNRCRIVNTVLWIYYTSNRLCRCYVNIRFWELQCRTHTLWSDFIRAERATCNRRCVIVNITYIKVFNRFVADFIIHYNTVSTVLGYWSGILAAAICNAYFTFLT